MILPRIKYVASDVTLLARIMRAEALNEGNLGMKLVGNVVVNRAVAQCLTFKNVNSIYTVVYQSGQFAGVKGALFKPYPTQYYRNLAKATLDYWRGYPATQALFFKNPGKTAPCAKRFYGPIVGRYKLHCFYNPENTSICKL